MDVSVLICTYNRARLLAQVLDSLAGSNITSALRWEVIVVDNNSTDATARIVRERMAAYPCPLRLVAEPRQGKSHALNAGIAASAAEIIAFTDDDVWVPPTWLCAAVGPLLARDDIEYTGGPVRPIWEVAPPSWTEGNPGLLWGPIALVDYGPDPFVLETRGLIALGVNMAVRRSLLCRVGGFHPAFERRGNSLLGQGQAEFFFRTRAAGARGLYVPDMWLKHHVPAARLTRQYYRRWWYWKGVARARIQDLHPRTESGVNLSTIPMIAGIPRFRWGRACRDAAAWLQAAATGNAVRRAESEMRLSYFAGYLRERLGARRAVHQVHGVPAVPSPAAPPDVEAGTAAAGVSGAAVQS